MELCYGNSRTVIQRDNRRWTMVRKLSKTCWWQVGTEKEEARRPARFLIWWDLWGQFSSVAQSCPTLCNPMDCSTPGFPVHHQLLEPTQAHVHHVGDAIQPSHPPLSSPLVGARALKCSRDPEEGDIQAELHLRAHEWKMHSWTLNIESETFHRVGNMILDPFLRLISCVLSELVSSTFKEKKNKEKMG